MLRRRGSRGSSWSSISCSSESSEDAGSGSDRLAGQKPPLLHLRRRRWREVDTTMGNIEVLVSEIVNKREAWGKAAGNKRRLPREDLINLDNYAKLREYIAVQLSEEDTHVPTFADLISISASSSPKALSPKFEFSTFPTRQWITPVFSPNTPDSPQHSFLPLLFDFHDLPALQVEPGWSPVTSITVTPPRSGLLDNVDNQALFQYYLEVPAQRLADSSPTYTDLFRKYVPAMAQDSPALMESLLGLADVQLALAVGQGDKLSLKSLKHYQRALEMHYYSLQGSEALNSDTPLATSLILSHYELWNGELIKMGVHMLGCRDIVDARGKAAHMTPVGRSLFAAFRRLDVSTSLISGNPGFQTNDWWIADPFTKTPILNDSPPLLAADVAFSKLCVICSRLSHLKTWIIRRRREVYQEIQADPGDIQTAKRESLEAKIDQKVKRLENDLESWLGELPPCFKPIQEDELEDEDINITESYSIAPKFYKHKAIGLVVGYGIGVQLQLYRLRYPDAPVLTSEVGSQCHTLLRIFAGLPTSCDAAMVVPLFAAGIELRQKRHQDWLLSNLDARIAETGFHALKFLREGVQFAYLKLEGMRIGRFINIKEGAASRIDGVSENLWSAEGMLCSMEALSLYDPDTSISRKTFQGDYDLHQVDLENEVPYETWSLRPSTPDLDRSLSPIETRERKRSKSVSPGPRMGSPNPM